jgi:hypothetical protein
MEIFLALLAILVYCAVYMVPTIVAVMREHQNTAPIAVVNIFTGWTFIGWVVCLAWSLTNATKD